MLKRKICLVLMVLLIALFFTPEKIYAGTCACAATSARLWQVSTDNCDSDEYASGCSGSVIDNPRQACTCIKKENSGLRANSCTCNGSGTITANNCEDSVPFCNTRGTAVCMCTGDGTLDTVGIKKSELPATTATSSYNPFDGCTSTSINTAIGCIPVEMSEFIPWLMSWLFGIAGGIAFLLMVYGFILIATSSGDEKKVQGAKETITSAIVGLLVCVFSVFILRLITVNILQIPGIS